MLKESRVILLLSILFLTFSCKNKKNFDLQYYSNGCIKNLTLVQKEKKSILSFDSLGNCIKITQFVNDKLQGEQSTFYNKKLVEKTDFLMGKENGHYYDFYSSTGAIKSHRYMVNGIEYGLGTEYYNLPNEVIKNSFYFNDSGKIYLKQYYDSSGKLLREEGHR